LLVSCAEKVESVGFKAPQFHLIAENSWSVLGNQVPVP
jgi:hypothetical protein